jgi:methionyl aminopeptidase
MEVWPFHSQSENSSSFNHEKGRMDCVTPTCKQKGSLVCPTCKKLGIPPVMSTFCNQVCFKGYWSTHKALHKMFTEAAMAPKQKGFDGFEFTGKLRPGKVSPMQTVPDHIKRPDYWETGIPVSEQQADNKIPVYTPEQIEGIRAACKAGREVLDIAGRALRVGITGDEIDRIVHEACIERDCYPSPLNYYHFPKSVCVSVNEVICHGIPDDRPIEVNLDVTVYKDGYHGDLNDTFLVGNVDEEGTRLVKNAFECLQNAVSLVKPGTMYRDLGKYIAATANAEGFSVVKTYCGHGIGSLFHCSPNVPHYANNKAVGIMKPGHIFTIEPMINVGSWKDKTWPDDWTAVTVDGKRSAQFEHTILVTDTGYELLTARENEPVMEWDLAKVQRPL